ncbi:actinodefensin-associated protein B [Streptomyces beigongshangae]|uniref:actinodefensin-associated protein B n=1 Tax=Streptomyces beigongshangae TaxID=2841597 RepID=UPI001C8659BC|nr:actinodefensin-associated protein B [Streptomyces sp. REN17]
MPTSSTSHRDGLRLAPHVRCTPLPFGGAVLVHAPTLSITECGEQEAHVVERLLSHGPPGPGTGPAGEAVRRLSQELVAAGWLETAPAAGRAAAPAPHDAESAASAPYDAESSAAPADRPSTTDPAGTAAPDTHRR